jgi:hypothetical protein
MRPCIICCIVPIQLCMFCIIDRQWSGMACIVGPIGICPCADGVVDIAGEIGTGDGIGAVWACGAASTGWCCW